MMGRRCTSSHKAWRSLVPQGTWPERPHIVPYIREGTSLTSTQPSPGLSMVLLQVRIEGPDSGLSLFSDVMVF